MFRVYIADGVLIRIRLLFEKVSIRHIFCIRYLDSSTSILTAKIYYTVRQTLRYSKGEIKARHKIEREFFFSFDRD